MSDITIITTAQEVVTALYAYNSVLAFAPEITLKGLETRKMFVIPIGVTVENASRSAKNETYEIQVVYTKRGVNENNVSTLIDDVQTIIRDLSYMSFDSARLIKSEIQTLFDMEDLRERRQFTSVFSLSFYRVEMQNG